MSADLVVAVAIIIGIVNGVTLLNAPQVTPFVKFLIALALGLLFGVIGLFGMNLETGIIAGLSSSGLYKLSQNIGGGK
jgi:prepilin signal peptidase PulO-like enzyme (type II secretory pathway)